MTSSNGWNDYHGHFRGSERHRYELGTGLDVATGTPDIIYFPIFLPAGAFIIDQAKTTPGLENTKLMGADGLFSPDVMKTAGAQVEGFMVSSPVVQGACL